MLTEIEPRTLAYINVNAVLGAIPELVRRVPKAQQLLAADKPASIEFAVHGGPTSALAFSPTGVQLIEGRHPSTIKLPFPTPGRLNKVIAGEAQPVPIKGLNRIGFLLHVFAPLTELLTEYLRPSPEALRDPEFRATSTVLTLYVALAAVAQVANEDRSGRFSAHLIPDGDLAVEIAGTAAYTLRASGHRLTFIDRPSPSPRAAMVFASLDVAGQLLSGEVSAMGCICDGTIAMRGMIPMVDNVNRILDRVTQYLGA